MTGEVRGGGAPALSNTIATCLKTRLGGTVVVSTFAGILICRDIASRQGRVEAGLPNCPAVTLIPVCGL